MADAAEVKKTVELANQLVAQANDASCTEEERRTFATRAVQLIAAEKLTVMPADVVEQVKKTVEGAIAKVRQDSQKKMVLGAIGGFLAARYIKL